MSSESQREAQPGTGTAPWWGDYELEPGEIVRWDLGPLRLWAGRLEAEWRIAFEPAADLDEEPETVTVERGAEPPGETARRERFVAPAGATTLAVRPLVADRTIVARPREPLHVPPGQEAVIFVSSPVWVELAVTGEPPVRLRDLPVKRLTDTWLGASTREGELAYALKTQARLQLAEMPLRPYRVLTPVAIRNEADALLPIDRLNLPVPYLSVFPAAGGALWTERVLMVGGDDTGMASFDVVPGPAPEAAGAELLHGPRLVAERGRLVRAFSSLLGFSHGSDGS